MISRVLWKSRSLICPAFSRGKRKIRTKVRMAMQVPPRPAVSARFSLASLYLGRSAGGMLA